MNKCRIALCLEDRQRDALYCKAHLNDAWAGRPPVVREARWVTWTREHNAGKILSGRAA